MGKTLKLADDKLHAKLKAAAQTRGQSIEALVTEALAFYLTTPHASAAESKPTPRVRSKSQQKRVALSKARTKPSQPLTEALATITALNQQPPVDAAVVAATAAAEAAREAAPRPPTAGDQACRRCTHLHSAHWEKGCLAGCTCNAHRFMPPV